MVDAGALYNEIDPFAAQWLRNLSAAQLIAAGRVDERSIRDLSPADVGGPGQRHFFAGIGVWSAALRDAGWPDDLDVWTGSCPCQPFSAAGRRRGTADDRHLWPDWFRLIRECRPAVVFGEQVASPDGLAWLDLVRADLEGAGYAFGAADLCAAGFGAPHLRQRLFFVAYTPSERFWRLRLRPFERGPHVDQPEVARRGAPGIVAEPERQRGGEGRLGGPYGRAPVEPDRHGAVGILGDADQRVRRELAGGKPGSEAPGGDGSDGDHAAPAGATRGFWNPADWIYCRDGKYRPVEPGTFPLAHGVAARVGRLRAYGNAIVRQVATTFIRGAIEAIAD